MRNIIVYCVFIKTYHISYPLVSLRPVYSLPLHLLQSLFEPTLFIYMLFLQTCSFIVVCSNILNILIINEVSALKKYILDFNEKPS